MSSKLHGTRSTYVQGCRCILCTSAERDYSREYRRKRRAGVNTSPEARVKCPESGDGTAARFVGAFLGDGWIRHSNPEVSGYSVGLAVGSGAENHTARYKTLCEALFKGSAWKLDAPGAYGLSCSAKGIHTWLKNHGLGDESPQRTIPQYVWGWTRQDKLSFLAGLVDSDGSVSANRKNKGRVTFCFSSEALTRGCHQLAVECGLEPTQVKPVTGVNNYGLLRAFRFGVKASTAGRLDLWYEEKQARLRKRHVQALAVQ